MAYVNASGGKIFWDATGNGPPVFFTHGYGVTSDMWDHQRRALGDAYKIVTWDIPGHGQSDSPDDAALYTENACIDLMRRIIDTAGAGKAVIGGLSLGGYLSLAYHHAFPDRVRALILCDTGPGFKDPASRAKWNERAEETAQQLERDGLPAIDAITENVVAKHRTTAGLIRCARGLFRQHDSRIIESLPSIRVPTLVVVGANDHALLAGCHYMARKIPAAELVIVPDSGHYPNVDQPEIFNAAVRKFLDGLPAA